MLNKIPGYQACRSFCSSQTCQKMKKAICIASKVAALVAAIGISALALCCGIAMMVYGGPVGIPLGGAICGVSLFSLYCAAKALHNLNRRCILGQC